MKRLLRKLGSESLFQAQSICGKTTKHLITYDMRVGSSPVLDIFILWWKRPFWWQTYVFRLKGARNIAKSKESGHAMHSASPGLMKHTTRGSMVEVYIYM